jgi:hypothetical protein
MMRGSEHRMRLVCALSAMLLGCGARIQMPSPTLLAGDEPLGVIGHEPFLIDANPTQRWAVFAQAREDTDGGGGVAIAPNGHGGYYGDRIDIWYVLGTDAGERITAYLGSTRDELGIVRDGNIEMVSIRRGTRRVIGPAAEITVMGIRGTPGWLIDGALWPDGRLVFLREGRHAAELVDIHTDARRSFAVEGWVHTAWIEPSHRWLVVEWLDATPTSEERPHRTLSGTSSHCWGLTDCEGAERHFTFFSLDDERHFEVPLLNATTRHWGIVAELRDHTHRIVTPDGVAHALQSECRMQYVGVESPVVVGQCVEEGPLLVWTLGREAPLPLDEALLQMEPFDRDLLQTPALFEWIAGGYSLFDEPVLAQREVHLPRFGYSYDDRRRFQWAPEEHIWHELPWEPRNQDILVVSPDGDALALRRGAQVRADERGHAHSNTQLVYARTAQ